MKIYLFTFSYPFGDGEQFVHNEVNFFAAQGVRLTIIPFKTTSKIRKLPKQVCLDLSMSEALSVSSESKGYPLFFSLKSIMKSFIQNPLNGISALRDNIGFAHHGRIIRAWAKRNLKGDEVLYTYWFERITFGLATYLDSRNAQVLITRAHRYDIYEDQRKHSYIPFRAFTLRKLSAVFCVSSQGQRYIVEKYGFEKKVFKSFLGTTDHGVSKGVNDGVLRLVSCSRIVPLKRVHLIAESIKQFSHDHPDLTLEWYHFGDGKLRKNIESMVDRVPKNLKVYLKGIVSNDRLLNFYRDHYVSLFVNLSSSEGLPVSIMEAMSFGIPVVATEVGGVAEIVDSESGILLSVNPAIEEIKRSFTFILAEKKLRAGARSKWNKEFVDTRNYASFYQKVKEISQ
ncbi:MAG: glycosyltransferase [Ekhidna sp.]|nr:glycosyltransferase [Ekhidna sp.]